MRLFGLASRLSLLVLLLSLATAAPAASITTPPDSGSDTKSGMENYAWTPPVDGFMTLSSSAQGCCSIASIEVRNNGTLLGGGPGHYFVQFRALASKSYDINVSTGGAGFTLYWTFHRSPVNDHFPKAIPLATSGSTSGSGDWATDDLASNDPAPDNDVWFRWRAPSHGDVTFGMSVAGSGAPGEGLVVYTGTALGSLQPVNASVPQHGSSFLARAGTYYRIGLKGGSYTLTWSFTAATLKVVGFVRDAAGVPQDGVTVELRDGASLLMGTQTTGHSGVAGRYTFKQIPAGNYTVTPLPQAGFSIAPASRPIALPTSGQPYSPDARPAKFTRTAVE